MCCPPTPPINKTPDVTEELWTEKPYQGSIGTGAKFNNIEQVVHDIKMFIYGNRIALFVAEEAHQDLSVYEKKKKIYVVVVTGSLQNCLK